MIVLVMAISNLVLTQQIYSEEANGAHAHYREPVPLKKVWERQNCEKWSLISETILPLVVLASTLLLKILPIKVAELLCTRVRLSIVGMNKNLCRESKNS